MNEKRETYPKGSFGNVVMSLGITWKDLSERTGVDRFTFHRWAARKHPIITPGKQAALCQVLHIINDKERRRGGKRVFTAAMLGLRLGGNHVVKEPDRLFPHISSLVDWLHGLSPREQFEEMAVIGRQRMSAVERMAWYQVWKGYCAQEFPYSFDAAVKTLPLGVPEC